VPSKPRSYVLPGPARQTAQKVFDRAFDSAAEVLVADHAELRQQEAENARVLNTRGDLPEALAQQYEGSRKQYEALHRCAGGVAPVGRRGDMRCARLCMCQ
jgi:hypothetical protein